MKLPKSVTIGGHTYKVKNHCDFKDQYILGRISHEHKEIRLSGKDVDVAFWHEVLHGIDRVYNAQRLDERAVAGLAQGLYQVIQGIVYGRKK